jgi:2-haloacid dehalogenase
MTSLAPYTWLLFDADGTLFDYEQAEAAALPDTFAQYGVPYAPDVLTAYREINAALWQALEQGQITQPVLAVRRFELLFETLARPAPPQFGAAYLASLASYAFLVDGAEAVLRALQPRYRIAILTNGISVVQRSRLARSAIHGCVSELIISEEVGAAKPEAAFFDAAFERLGQLARSEALMIGDSLSSDIRGASRYGLDTCWYNPSRQPPPEDLALTYQIAALEELIPLLSPWQVGAQHAAPP